MRVVVDTNIIVSALIAQRVNRGETLSEPFLHSNRNRSAHQ